MDSKPIPFRRWPVVLIVLIGGGVALWWQGRRSAAGPRERVAVLVPPVAVTGEKPAPPPKPRPAAEKSAPKPAAKVASWPKSEEQLAIEIGLKTSDPNQRLQQFAPPFHRWMIRDLEGALTFLREMPRGAEYSQALFMVLDAIGRTDPDRAISLAGELANQPHEYGVYSALFYRLAHENPAAAMARLERVPRGEPRETALRALANGWYQREPDAALAWAQKLSPNADRDVALEAVINNVAGRDPARAIELAQKSLAGTALERVLSHAIQMLAGTDPVRASALVGTLPLGDIQTNAAMTVARVLSQKDLSAALAWIKTLPVDITQWLALNSVLSSWAQKDLPGAARYVLDMPPGPALDFAARHFAALMASNPRDAILWAEALPTESARAVSLVMIATIWAQTAPAEAVRWAMTLPTEPLRTDAVTSAHAFWMLKDAPAARAWAEKASLPATTKSILIRGGVL